MDIPVHPIANIFPLLEGIHFRELVEDIRVHGLREPIVLYDGAILDGRNRARACRAAQVSARYKTYDGRDPLAFVISANLHRRHLDVSQRALIAARISEKKAGGRQGPSKKVGGKLAKRPRPERYKIRAGNADKVSQHDAARLMNVSDSSVMQAHRVVTSGVPELVQAVERGDVAVSAAATVSAFRPDQQRNILKSGSKTVAIIARADKQEKKKRSARPGHATAPSPYASFRIGDGRAIGNVRVGEIEQLERLMLVTAEVLRAIREHYANPDHTARVSAVITEAKLSEFIDAAWSAITRRAASA